MLNKLSIHTIHPEYIADARMSLGGPPMKILVYGLNYAPELTGIGKYTSELCVWLSALGHTVRVVTGHPYYPDWKVSDGYNPTQFQTENRDGIEIFRCPLYVPSTPTGKKRVLSHLSFSITSAVTIIKSAKNFKPDLILCIAPSFFVTPAALAAAKLYRIPAWLHVQDFEIDSAFELGILKGSLLRRIATAAESSILKKFDVVSAISSKMVDRLIAKGVDQQRAIEFRNWVNTKAIRPLDRMTKYRTRLGLTSDHIVALYSGSIAAKQGIESLVTAARQIGPSYPQLTFLFCGNGAMQGRLMRAAQGLVNARFLDLQPDEDMPELLATADIHLIPQRSQVADLMMPSKLAPILSSGRPVVVMAEPGTQLADEVGAAGIAVAPGNEQALTSAICKLADDPQTRLSMGQKGRELACERWEKENLLREFEQKLRRLATHAVQNG